MSLPCPKGKFKKGDIVRYDAGSTALMRLRQYSGDCWYGEQFFGGGASQRLLYRMKAANAEERKSYRAEEKKRHGRLAKDLRNHIKSLKKELAELRP